MKSATHQPFSQTPTGVPEAVHSSSLRQGDGHAFARDIHEDAAGRGKDHVADDDGMMGSHTNDKVMLGNAHPHTQHSVGYHVESPRHQPYENHGIEATHVVHHKRDKNAEHHPPKGLYDPGVVDHEKFTQSVF